MGASRPGPVTLSCDDLQEVPRRRIDAEVGGLLVQHVDVARRVRRYAHDTPEHEFLRAFYDADLCYDLTRLVRTAGGDVAGVRMRRAR